MPNIPHQCKTCSYGKAITDGQSIIGYECHRYAPKPMMLIAPRDIVVTPQLVWPVILLNEGCGDWATRIKGPDQSC